MILNAPEASRTRTYRAPGPRCSWASSRPGPARFALDRVDDLPRALPLTEGRASHPRSFPDAVRLILCDLVNATMGIEQLATLTAEPSKSQHRMLSPTGNPSMDNLAAIFRAIRDRLQVNFEARAVAV